MIDAEKYVKIISSQTEKPKSAESVGVEINNQDITITENGVYTADAGYTGIGTATVNVPQSQPVIESLGITPTTSEQTITATGGVNGYSPITVSAVTSSIDENIIAGNIKSGVSILGVTGNMNPAPESYRVFRVNSNKLTNSISTPFIPLPAGTKDIDNYVFANAYVGTPSNILNGTIDLSSLTSISGTYACYNMFKNCTGITSVNLSSVTLIANSSACNSMFIGCKGITSINLSSLTTISNAGNCCSSMFAGCTGLTTIDLRNLTSIQVSNGCSSMFFGCTNLTSANLSGLTTIASGGCQGMFESCVNLTSVDLSSLRDISNTTTCAYMFSNCTSLTRLDFPALTSTSFGTRTSQFDNMLSGVTGCTVHFPSNLQSIIGSWDSVLNGFGGTNTTVSFDLTATS